MERRKNTGRRSRGKSGTRKATGKRSRPRRPPPPRAGGGGPSGPVILIAGALLGLIPVGLLFLARKPAPAPEPAEPVAAATATPEPTPEELPPEPIAIEEPSQDGATHSTTRTRKSPLQAALREAAAEEDAGRLGAAYDLLDDYEQAFGGGDADLAAAKKQLLVHGRQILETEVLRAAEQVKAGRKRDAAQVLIALRERLPRALASDITQAVRDLGLTDAAIALSEEDPDAKAFYERLARLEESQGDADGYFELGQWAKSKQLEAEAERCFAAAITLDAFHEGARKALGHHFHEGRWYTEDEYKREVLGLVLDAFGQWVDPRELAKRDEARKKQGGRPVGGRPAGGVPERPKGDTAWFDDHESTGSFADAQVYPSQFYEIKTNVKPEYAKRYGQMMDRYFKRFVKVFANFMPKGRIGKSEIWIYASRQEFMQAEQVGPTTGGYYSPATKRVVAYHGRFGAKGNTQDVLAHEGTHQFEDIVLKGRMWNAPIWIIEGLAVFFESAYYDGKKVVIGLVPQDRLASLKRGLAANRLIPLRTLIQTPQRSFTGYHYAHAWALIYWVLYSSDKPKVRKRNAKWFSDLFTLALERPVSHTDVIERMGGDEQFSAFEEQWKEWIRDLPYDFNPKKS